EPGGALGVGLAAELVLVLVRLEQGLLHDVAGVHQSLELRVELEPGEQPEVFAETLQRPAGAVVAGHADPPEGKKPKPAPARAGRAVFQWKGGGEGDILSRRPAVGGARGGTAPRRGRGSRREG